MYAHDRQVDVVEQFMMELDRQAGAEENHDLLFAVLFEECEKKQEPFLWGADNVAWNITIHVANTERHKQRYQNTFIYIMFLYFLKWQGQNMNYSSIFEAFCPEVL